MLAVVIAALTAAPAGAADAPPNDAFAAAAPVAVGETLSGTTAGATQEAGEPSVAGEGRAFDCSGGECQRSVWYVLRPSVSGPVSLHVCGAVAEVYTGPGLASLGGVASNRLGECPAEQTTAFDAVAGMTYWIGIAGHRGAAEPFTARVTAEPDTRNIVGGGYAAVLPVTFELASRNAGASFECALDDGAFAPCSERPSFGDLDDGTHTLYARAVVGSAVDPSPSSAPVTVDRRAPSASITAANPEDGGTSTDHTARFTVASNEAAASVYCAVDDEPLHACGSPGVQFDVGGLCSAPHQLTAVVVDYAGNLSGPVTSRWTTAQQPSCKAPGLGTPESRAGWKTADVDVPVVHGGSSRGGGARLVLAGPDGERRFDLPLTGGRVRFPIQDLQPNTEFGYTISARNPQGSAPARTGSFTTDSAPPGSATASVSDVTEHEATLNGFVDGAGQAFWLFRFGETAGYGRLAPHGWAFPESPVPASFSYRIGGLRSGTLHHYRLENRRTDLFALVDADLPDATFTTGGVPPDDGGGGDGGGDGGGGPAPPGPSPPAPGPPAGPAPSATPGAARVVSAGRARLAGRGKKLTLETGLAVECPAGTPPCSVQATARAKRGRRRPVIARSRRTLPGGRRAALRVKVTKSGLRVLRDRRRLRATLLVSLTRAGAAPEVIERKLRVAVPRRLR